MIAHIKEKKRMGDRKRKKKSLNAGSKHDHFHSFIDELLFCLLYMSSSLDKRINNDRAFISTRSALFCLVFTMASLC
jgi:hypothetical protein